MCILIKNENDGIYGTELYNEDSIINSIEVDDNYFSSDVYQFGKTK